MTAGKKKRKKSMGMNLYSGSMDYVVHRKRKVEQKSTKLILVISDIILFVDTVMNVILGRFARSFAMLLFFSLYTFVVVLYFRKFTEKTEETEEEGGIIDEVDEYLKKLEEDGSEGGVPDSTEKHIGKKYSARKYFSSTGRENSRGEK